jgi:putative transposase
MASGPHGPQRVEVITSIQRRRRWSAAEKVRLVEEAMQPGSPVSAVARQHGIAPSQLFAWKRRMLEGGLQAVAADEDVVGSSQVRDLEGRVRQLERLLGRKTMEAEILEEALDLARPKNRSCGSARGAGSPHDEGRGRPLGVARSNLARLAAAPARSRQPYRKVADAELLTALRQVVDQRPTYGYRRLTALLNRQRRADSLPPVNGKRVLRVLRTAGPTLQAHTARRPGRTHDGTVAALRPDTRWCSDHLELLARDGAVVRVLFAIDACDREVVAWSATTTGVSGGMVRDLMVICVERRFGTTKAAHPVEWLSDNGAAYTAKDTLDLATALGLRLAFTPPRSPESNGLAEAWVKTLQARLRQRHLPPGRARHPPAPAGLDRGLQRQPPPRRVAHALTPGVPRAVCLDPTRPLSAQTGCTPMNLKPR